MTLENRTAFEIYLQGKDYSPGTKKVYLSVIRRFIKWYGQDVINAQTKDVLKYLEYLQQKFNMQNGSRQGHLNALRQYFTYLERSEVTAFITITSTKKQRLQYIFSSHELTQLYDDYNNIHIQNIHPDCSIIAAWRNYIILGLIVYQGLRTTELDALQVDDIDIQKATLNIKPSGNLGNKRNLPIQACQIGSIMYYLNDIRPQLCPSAETSKKLLLPLSELRYRGSNKAQSIAVSLWRLNRQLKKLHKDYQNLKQIRNSRITQWIKSQGLRKTQYLAGHKSIISTEEYLRNDLEALTDDLSKYHPLQS